MINIYFKLFFFFSFLLFAMGLNFLVLDYILIIEYNLLMLNSNSLVMSILLDWMSLMFMSFVLFISSMVIFYSKDYMIGDLNLNRFILLVVLFVFSMIFLIISPNLVSILLGWDGLGLVSYCLVIYYQNVKSFNAGMLTALSNRVGDVALLMGIAWMVNFGSWSYVYYLDMMIGDKIMGMIACFVMLAALTKSAQIPFSSWLPAAMAAPTPVSSLVHSSTLVTAGVYLMIRFNVVMPPLVSTILLFLGSLTMLMSGLGANFEYDLKKIIALSTLSQLGLMMSILALGSSTLAFFHLLTHALFKALLFMCAGNIIHMMSNCQDIRYMGSIINQMPLTSTFMNISNFSLCGLPFLSGFYSKDLIVESMSMNYLNLIIYLIFYLSIGLTVMYSFRLSYYSLTGTFNYLSLHSIKEDSVVMLKSMGGIILFVIFMGSMLSWMIFSTPIYICLPLMMKLMALLMILSGVFIGYEMFKLKMTYHLKSLMCLTSSTFSALMWNLPILSTLGVNLSPLWLGDIYLKLFDQGWIEYYGGKNLSFMISKLSMKFQYFSLNYVKMYFVMMVIWVIYLLMNMF
uniref:NADH-ubiquinone oxidoreductase chain 5 n=1 Tax=Caryopemon giganteus TaxID=2758555 RepID=A0A7D6Z5L8_9CUCU|nr:NADH dehydrogenase subunit 5 [Caryopemon giganteus]QLX47629.1 NADH dehydrogenase subunit 5 [Caryopemon giganteus]